MIAKAKRSLKGILQLGILFLVLNPGVAFTQKRDSLASLPAISGSVSLTQNGISLIPTFSLGKPATILNLNLGKRRFRFEPELRFALEGKPWSFLFWFRYLLLSTKRLRLNIGAHPAINFRTEPVTINGIAQDQLISRRYLATEFSPQYILAPKTSLGMYYLFSKGLDAGTIGTTHFITLNMHFTQLSMPGHLLLSLAPQLYYLKLDETDGYYTSASLGLSRNKCPLSVTAILNKSLRTAIPGKNFIWNASIIYTF